MSLREYKNDVFIMLMEKPEYAIDAYNALAGKNYEVSDIQIQKLNKGVMLSVRNDASFLIDSYLNLWEHQSTFNPNMPLRFLLYVADIIHMIIKGYDYDIFGKKRIPIPTPKFVVIYNGLEERPEKEIFRLSDSFKQKCDSYDLELICEVYNINPGCNETLHDASKVISGYTTFVEKVRFYAKEMSQLEDAVSKAIDECIAEDTLADFFIENRSEVLRVAVLDFTFERREKLIARDNFEEGLNQGLSKGLSQGLSQGRNEGLSALVNSLICFLDTPEEIWETIKKNKAYENVTLEEVKEILVHRE